MMNVLILGKNGQLGQSLQQIFAANHVNYIAVGRDQLDLTDAQAIKDFFVKQHNFDFVINAAAYTAVDQAETDKDLAFAVNEKSVAELAKQCALYNIPLIHISTDYVFDGEKKLPYDETDEPNPMSVYGQSKLAGEHALSSHWFKHIILRVSWVFSPFNKNFVKTIARLASERDELSIVADQYGSPTSAISIAEVIFDICKQLMSENKQDSKWGIYHYSDFPLTTWHQLAVTTCRLIGKEISIKPINTEDYPLPARRPNNSAFNTQKILENFGIIQKSWEEKLRKQYNNHVEK